jgi:hypothetical protein
MTDAWSSSGIGWFSGMEWINNEGISLDKKRS